MLDLKRQNTKLKDIVRKEMKEEAPALLKYVCRWVGGCGWVYFAGLFGAFVTPSIHRFWGGWSPEPINQPTYQSIDHAFPCDADSATHLV